MLSAFYVSANKLLLIRVLAYSSSFIVHSNQTKSSSDSIGPTKQLIGNCHELDFVREKNWIRLTQFETEISMYLCE